MKVGDTFVSLHFGTKTKFTVEWISTDRQLVLLSWGKTEYEHGIVPIERLRQAYKKEN